MSLPVYEVWRVRVLHSRLGFWRIKIQLVYSPNKKGEPELKIPHICSPKTLGRSVVSLYREDTCLGCGSCPSSLPLSDPRVLWLKDLGWYGFPGRGSEGWKPNSTKLRKQWTSQVTVCDPSMEEVQSSVPPVYTGVSTVKVITLHSIIITV